MFCINCGASNPEGSKFCSSCGEQLQTVQKTSQPSEEMQVPPPQSQAWQNPNTPVTPPQSQAWQNPNTPVTPPQSQAWQNPNSPVTPPQSQTWQNPNSPVNQSPFQGGQTGQFNYQPTQKAKKNSGCIVALIIGVLVLILLFAIILLFPSEWLESDNIYDAYTNVQSDLNDDDISQPTPPNGAENVQIRGTYTGIGTYGTSLGLTDVRDFYTTIKGDGTDTHTIMMYIIGSDLESYNGFASSDIKEMLMADFGDNINLILMTGGAYSWELSEISGSTCQYWQVKDGELISINSNVGLLDMCQTETLSSFINTATSSFPADRYSLIFWDHGGGTISGFGYDEHYPDSILSLSEISDALAQTSVKYDFIGFDACLMATAETAYMLEPYADYMLASQELVPGNGWYYTDWLTYFSENPSAHTVDLAAKIIDDYVTESEYNETTPSATLSVIELRQMPYTYQVITDYFDSSIIDIQNNEYAKLSQARSDAKAFNNGRSDQIDLVDYVIKSNVSGSQTVIDAVSNAVSYYHNSYEITDSYGMAMYFPYEYIGEYSFVQDVLYEVGYESEYTRFFNVFISAMSGGQMRHNENFDIEPAEDFSTEEWYDEDIASDYEELFDDEIFQELIIDEKNDGYVLSLSDEQWEEIVAIELQVLLDDGEGYIDLGSDNVYTFDDDGDLRIEFDYTWVAIDGNIVPFYAEEETINGDDWSTHGRVPAFLNGEYVEIIVYWDSENPEGYVAGYRKETQTGAPVGKGYFQLELGDSIDWIIDYYTYDIIYDDYYFFGETFIVPDEELSVSYDYVGDMDAFVYFVLTDVYNNVYETEAIIYTD